MTAAVLIPVKSFTTAKGRLATALDAAGRRDLAQRLAEGVVDACRDLDVWIVSEDDAVAQWAASLGARVVHNPTAGLNQAVRHGVATLHEAGVARVLVTHADLAQPAALPSLLALDGLVLVPDRRLEGTNALVVPTASGFTFSYGVGSFARHLSEAERMGLPLHVVRANGLDLDIDDGEDLELARTLGITPTA